MRLIAFKHICLPPLWRYIWSIIFIFFLNHNAICNIDSLKLVLKKATHDTTRCRILNAIIEEEENESIWMVFNNQLKKLTEKNLKKPISNDLKRIYLIYLAGAINNEGVSSYMNGDFKNALKHYEKSLTIRNLIQDSSGIASSLQNIGTLYSLQGNPLIALDYYEKSIKIQNYINDKKGTAASLHNIATIYNDQGDNLKAQEYFLKSLKIEEEITNKSGIASTLDQLGNSYVNSHDFEKSLDCYQKSLSLSQEIGDPITEASAYEGLSNLYLIQNDFEKSILYINKCLELNEKNNDVYKISSSLNKAGLIYYNKKDLKKAKDYCNKSLVIAQKSNYLAIINKSALLLKNIYTELHSPGKALEMYELYNETNETIINEETKKASMRSQLKHEYELKASEEKAKTNEEKRLSLIKLKQEKKQRYLLYGFLSITLLFSIFILNRFRITRKQKNIIEEQKHLVENKQKEIIDSITYAKRLQEAILPPQEFIDSSVPENFILYLPKDVVAGDFYWAETIKENNNDLFFIAAADSTGHGVPGAMVSVVCSNALNRSVKEFKLHSTNEILDKTRDLVIQTFEKSSSDVKDGMDISLLCLDKKNKQITWSGANNSLLYIHNQELFEIKPDKQPIGKSENQKPFTQHQIKYTENTTFYLITDGYADQFGGEKGKKYMYQQLKTCLLNISNLPFKEQKEKLLKDFNTWKGDLEQVDDVLIIGFKL